MDWQNRIVGYITKSATELTGNPRNPRRHPQRQRDAVRGSLDSLGWIAPVIENVRTGYLIDGHERVMQALGLGDDTQVPVIQVDLAEHEEAQALATFDFITYMAEYDRDYLDALLRETNSDNADIQALLAEMAVEFDIVTDPEPIEAPEAQIDRAEELLQKWNVQRGDLWIIGEHRLLCGDSTSAEDVARVMGGERAEYAIQDPPYGISVVGGSKSFGSVGGSNIVKSNVYTPIVGDNIEFDPRPFLAICPNTIFWGANYYADKLPPKKGWIVWDKKGRDWDDNFSDCELAWTPFDIVTSIYRYVWMGMVQTGEREVRTHPTQKPAGLYALIIKDLFSEKSTVLDCFGGSGTTMVACEQLQRKCRMIEIEPKYCAVILERMSQMGLAPEKSDG